MKRVLVYLSMSIALLLPSLASGQVLVDISIEAVARGYNEKNPVGPIKATPFTIPGPGTLQVTYEVDPYRGPDSDAGRAGGWELYDFPGCQNRKCIPGNEIPMERPTPVVGQKFVRVYRSEVTERYENRMARLVPTHEWVGFDSREGSQWGAKKCLKVEFFPKGSVLPPAGVSGTSTSSGSAESTGSMGTGKEVKLFDNGNVHQVLNAPTQPTRFTLKERSFVSEIVAYHFNGSRGAEPGLISLRDGAGGLVGQWQASTSPTRNGDPKLYWTVTPQLALGPGGFSVEVSHPATWSHNKQSGNAGMVWIMGWKMEK